MASTGHDETKQQTNLHLAFKSLGEERNETKEWKEHTEIVLFYILKELSELLEKNSENCILFRPYGSAAEDLKCMEPNDVGDVDVVIYPNSDGLTIHDEFIEYLPEHPMHVRIKGSNHPVLQSCLLENTEYVATSALKNFHPAIYGSLAPCIMDAISRAHQQIMTSELSDLLQSTSQVKNSAASPAVTLKFTQSLKGPPHVSPHVCADEWEWLVNVFCNITGTVYTKEHAKVIDDITHFMNDFGPHLENKGLNTISEMLPAFLEFYQSERAKTLQARFQSTKSQPHDLNETQKTRQLSTYKAIHIDEQQYFASDSPCGRQSEAENKGALSFYEWSCAKTQNCRELQREAKGNAQTFMRNIPGNSDAVDDRSEKRNGDLVESRIASKTEPLIVMQKKDSPCYGPQRIRRRSGNDKDEKRELKKRIRDYLFDHVFGTITDAKNVDSFLEASSITEIGQTKYQREGGFDFVPAFKSTGWPKVAQEWIRRKRKWPSQKVIDRVLEEGFHLVVKAPKDGGNLECDFRISFANAEYLLSRDLNNVQRECYRCLKKFHPAYFSTKPKSLVSFHLKNLFLQTVEETGADMWTESNRVKCMMKLFGRLLEALRKKDLRHYFVRSYNLFSEDYIEDLSILESLAGICEEVIVNPIHFARTLNKGQKEEKCSHHYTPTLSAQGQHDMHQDIPSKCSQNEQTTHPKTSSSVATSRYHDLQGVFQSISKEMCDLAFKDPSCSLQSLHPLEKSIIEDLREIEKYQIIQVADFPKMFDICWNTAYYKVLIDPEPNIRNRILYGIKGVLEMCKYVLKQDDFASGNEDAIVRRMLDPTAEDSFDLNHILPAASGPQFIRRIFRGSETRSAQVQNVNLNDIPLD